jgi:hypothetical protein
LTSRFSAEVLEKWKRGEFELECEKEKQKEREKAGKRKKNGKGNSTILSVYRAAAVSGMPASN